jgi:hypothetical protein
MSKRVTGYYWVKFDWPSRGRPRQEVHWEPASWDANAGALKGGGWAMIGTNQFIPVEAERHVFLEINEKIIKEPR